MKETKPNPAGKHGKPIMLGDMSFEEAVKKMLGTQPPPKEIKRAKSSKKPAERKR